MSQTNPWLLPEGVNEALPEEAARLENLRRRLLDMYAHWGYQLIMPPFIEYLSSLLTGTGADLDLQTFKLTDQLTGRLMGIRADITPQAARIDAHRLKREEPVRLCYIGTVLHSRPDGFAGNRAPLQVGVELYGYEGIEGDIEVLALMLETLHATGIKNFHIDLGHVGIYRSLIQQAGLRAEQEKTLFDAVQRKAVPDIHAMLSAWETDNNAHDMLIALMSLNGGRDVLEQAHQVLAPAYPGVHKALDDLARILEYLPNEELHFDLAELRGYSYHTGVSFAAYSEGHGEAVAQGGRYDHIGEIFGRSRPATGFSTDLKTLTGLAPKSAYAFTSRAIFAPAAETPGDPVLRRTIKQLRSAGEVVICGLPGVYNNAAAMGCTRELRRENGVWKVVQAEHD